MRSRLTIISALLLAVMAGVHMAGAGELLKPPAVWKDFDPNKGDFKEEIIKQDTANGILYRESYISAYVLDQEIRVFCKYSVKAGVTKAPGLLNVHGWMGAPTIETSYVDDGWAVMAHDYCGNNGKREHYTKYPVALSYCIMDKTIGTPNISSTTPDGKAITDPRWTSDYIWYAIERRVLSYLEQQKEVDKTRLGARGYSYGGTLMWPLATDPRIKAVVAYFGIGWLEYYRSKQVWLYNNPYVEPPKTPGEEIYLAGIAPEAYVPYITAPTLFLNGSNDHHGVFERGLESFKMFRPGVPWAFAVQVRGHHNTEKTGQDCKMWLEKYVLNKEVFWPAHPQSVIRLDSEGVPELIVTPASPERVKTVEMYYALKSPCYFARSWRDIACARKGDTWVGKMPVMNVDDYVFGYANINYDTTAVVSTDFNAAIPSKLGKAKATDKKADGSSSGNERMTIWSNVAEAEGPKGIKGFRSTDNKKGSSTEALHDPKWQAPPNTQLSFKFYCTEPQTLILTANDKNNVEIEITASDDWQEMVVPANNLINRTNKQPMAKDWSGVGSIQLRPKQRSDITKVIFAEFRWIEPKAGGR